MGLSHSPAITTRNLLLNLDFGNIQKCYNGSENLLTYSQDISNGNWIKGQSSAGSLSTAPDGTTTAYKLVEDTSNNFHFIYQQVTLTSTYYTLSCFVKAAERSFGYIQVFNGTDNIVTYFNLSTGVVGNGTGTDTITPYPNGWYRISVSGNVTTAGSATVYIVMNSTYVSGTYQGIAGYGLYFWGLQLERGQSASPYIETTASTVTRPTTATSTISNYSHTINQSQYISYDATNNSIRFDRNETFANFTGSITSNVLTVTAMSGITTIVNGAALSYSGVVPTRYITSFGTGIGTIGTYNVNAGIDTTSRAMTGAYKIGGNMTVTTTNSLLSNTYLYTDHTTEVWARINDRTAANYDGYEGESVLVTFSGYHSMFLYYSGGLRYGIWDNTGPTMKFTSELSLGTSGTDIIQGQWFQVVATKSGTTFKTYLNGVLKKTDTITSTAFVGVSNNLRLGAAGDGNTGAFYYYAKNNVGCLKMYNAALSADEIMQNYNSLRGRFRI